MKILCVDDDRVTLSLISRTLEESLPDDSILTASSGEEALEVFRACPVDILITDLVMPGISGLDLLKTVKSDRPETEVIMATAYASVESAVAAMKGGARDYLPKPLNRDLIVEKVSNLKEYLQSRKEVEEYRYAMSAMESDSNRSGKLMEKQLSLMAEVMIRVEAILESPAGPEKKIDLIRDCMNLTEASGV
jgi:YesN/AraC family two-component response regulator